MAINNGFKQAVAKERQKEALRTNWNLSILRQQYFDIAVMAAGRCGLTGDDMVKFRDAYFSADDDYYDAIMSDTSDLEYAMYSIDREIKYYVPEELFHTYEERMTRNDPNHEFVHLWIPRSDKRYAESVQQLGKSRQHSMHCKRHR